MRPMFITSRVEISMVTQPTQRGVEKHHTQATKSNHPRYLLILGLTSHQVGFFFLLT